MCSQSSPPKRGPSSLRVGPSKPFCAPVWSRATPVGLALTQVHLQSTLSNPIQALHLVSYQNRQYLLAFAVQMDVFELVDGRLVKGKTAFSSESLTPRPTPQQNSQFRRVRHALFAVHSRLLLHLCVNPFHSPRWPQATRIGAAPREPLNQKSSLGVSAMFCAGPEARSVFRGQLVGGDSREDRSS